VFFKGLRVAIEGGNKTEGVVHETYQYEVRDRRRTYENDLDVVGTSFRRVPSVGS